MPRVIRRTSCQTDEGVTGDDGGSEGPASQPSSLGVTRRMRTDNLDVVLSQLTAAECTRRQTSWPDGVLAVRAVRPVASQRHLGRQTLNPPRVIRGT